MSCNKATDALLGLQGDNQALIAHRRECPHCSQATEVIGTLRSAIESSAADGLDQVARLRIQNRVLAELTQPPPRQGARWALWIPSALALVLLAAWALWPRAKVIGDSSPPQQAKRIVPPPLQQTAPLALYLIAGRGALDRVSEIGATHQVLRAEAGQTLRARLGATDVLLRGPGRLSTAASADGQQLTLHSGRLVVDSPTRHDQPLAIVAGQYRIVIVGTRFAVARPDAISLTVVVERGEVAIFQSAEGIARLRAGQTWSNGNADGALNALLERTAWSPPASARHWIARVSDTTGSLYARGHYLGEAPLVAQLPLGLASIDLRRSGHARRIEQRPLGAVRRRALPAVTNLRQPVKTRRKRSPAARTQPRAPDVAVDNPGKTGERQPTRPTAEARYRAAEQAIARGELPVAQRIFEQLLDDPTAQALWPTARLDLARVYLRRGDPRRAAQLLAAVPQGSSLSGAAHFLRCQAKLRNQKHAEAFRCLETFQTRYPGSGQLEQALFLSAQLAEKLGGCRQAKPLIERYLRRFAHGRYRQRLVQRCNAQ
ncbi:MAG: FecR domain-containing protein [Deltaproteobacteria bacterium]|nr:FecR domain-containing protein [Deltaproteobacteria bacterium]